MNFEETIILVVDVRNWAFDNIAQYVKSLLVDKYDCHILYSTELKNYKDFLKSLEQYKSIKLIHFFYRGYLVELLKELAMNYHKPRFKIKKLLNIAITFGIPDHLFILSQEEILNNLSIFQFADNYYTTSKKLYECYKNIAAYPPPGLVIYDNVLIDHANFELEKKLEKEQAAELTVSWIGNSSWGEWYNGYSDYKGLNSIIKPAFKQLAAEKIKIKKCIIDKNDRIRSRQEIWEILKKTDVLLIASIEEGTPLTLIEAMSFGCAIISTNVGIVSEILPEIQKKFIINRDPIKFATAIKHLANQRKLLSALQKQNVLMYQKIFGNDFAPKQLWVSFIQDAINNSVLETVVKAKQQVLKNLAFMHDKNCFVMKKLLKNIIHLPFIKKPIKYLLEYSWIRESVKKIISTFLFSTVSKHYDIKKFILRYQDQPTTDNEDVHVIYSGAFPGVANSTKLLFNKIIPFPAESLSILSVIYMMLPRKTAATIAKLIIDSKIKNLVISGGLDIHIQLVEQLYRLKGTKDLAIYLLWHGSPAQWVDSWHCYDFYKWFLLYQQNKIQGIITLKKGLEEFLKANSIRSYLLQNFIPDFGKLSYKSVKSFSLREKFSIGLWSVSAVWIKNLYPQIAALTMFKGKIKCYTNFSLEKNKYANWMIKALDVKFFPQYLPHTELLNLMSDTDLTLYITNSECSPMIALESLSLGIPCLVGPSSDIYDDEFLRHMLTVNRVDCPLTIFKAIEKIKENIDIIREKLPDFVKKYNQNANFLKNSFLTSIKD